MDGDAAGNKIKMVQKTLAEEIVANGKVDLCGTVCPFSLMTALDKIKEAKSGDVVEIIIEDDESLANISKSVKNEGHQIIKLIPAGEEGRANHALFVKKT